MADDDDSDYGWDTELDEHLRGLIQEEAATTTIETGTVENGKAADGGLAVLDALGGESVQYPDLSRLLDKIEAERTETEETKAEKTKTETETTETKAEKTEKTKTEEMKAAKTTSHQVSPLARFRTPPRKSLSVSDLVAGAWCELQYEYTLTRLPYGRPTRTAAMRGGTAVHARLEQEVHRTVEVQVATREDVHGLRLWNMVQGLRTLRDSGLTRELDIVGMVQGQVVVGVIDMLSYARPEASEPEEPRTPRKRARSPAAFRTPRTPQSTRITDFFSSPSQPKEPPRRVYITDIKTRGVNSLPSDVATRPTKVQLLLYHRFLADLAAGRLDWQQIWQRYAVDPDAVFSDVFLAQMAELGDEDEGDEEDEFYNGPEDNLRYWTLNLLLELLQAEVALTFPQGAASVGDCVAAEYHLRSWEARETGRHIGTVVLAVDEAFLNGYLGHYLGWWRGQRPAAGVDIEEASLKCGHCEFAGICDWRLERELDGVNSRD